MIPRLIAFHLPQFHPVPENDAWWGKGFTEWTNVTRARPQFEGHYQPHLPADLGFYDLRLPESREAQARLARDHDIYGFCYYHYWFNGRRILERPVNEILASGRPDFPFCLCWANENWTRRWDGGDQEVLLAQHYSEADDRAHLRSLVPALRDPRYIQVRGRPFLLIYRASLLPDPARTVATWREEAAVAGLPGLFLANVESFVTDHGLAPKAGFDAAVEFAPDWTCLPPRLGRSRFERWRARLTGRDQGYLQHRVYDYRELRDRSLAKPPPDYLRFRCATPSWDNTARRKANAIILANASPDEYQAWLRPLVAEAASRPPDERIVFVNAWNEWAEGNHLEPCQQWGPAYLQATRDALRAGPRVVS